MVEPHRGKKRDRILPVDQPLRVGDGIREETPRKATVRGILLAIQLLGREDQSPHRERAEAVTVALRPQAHQEEGGGRVRHLQEASLQDHPRRDSLRIIPDPEAETHRHRVTIQADKRLIEITRLSEELLKSNLP